MGCSGRPAVLRAAGVVQPGDPVRQARDRPFGPRRGTGAAGGAHGRPASGDGRGGIGARGDHRAVRRRAAGDPVLGDLPRARLGVGVVRNIRLQHAERGGQFRGRAWGASRAGRWGGYAGVGFRRDNAPVRTQRRGSPYAPGYGRLRALGRQPADGACAVGHGDRNRCSRCPSNHQRADAHRAPRPRDHPCRARSVHGLTHTRRKACRAARGRPHSVLR